MALSGEGEGRTEGRGREGGAVWELLTVGGGDRGRCYMRFTDPSCVMVIVERENRTLRNPGRKINCGAGSAFHHGRSSVFG